jgi:hypothetical protein
MRKLAKAFSAPMAKARAISKGEHVDWRQLRPMKEAAN